MGKSMNFVKLLILVLFVCLTVLNSSQPMTGHLGDDPCSRRGHSDCENEVQEDCVNICESRSSQCEYWYWDWGECLPGPVCYSIWSWGCEDGYGKIDVECEIEWGCWPER